MSSLSAKLKIGEVVVVSHRLEVELLRVLAVEPTRAKVCQAMKLSSGAWVDRELLLSPTAEQIKKYLAAKLLPAKAA